MNNFLALENNFTHALEANEVALDSAGSAAQENERYLESLNAKASAVKSTFQQLSASVVDSGLVKSVLDLANAFLQLANTPIGVFVTQTTLLTGILWGGTGIINASKIIPSLINGINISLGVLGKTLHITFPMIGAIALAITALLKFGPKIKDWYKKQTDGAYAAESAIEEYNEQLQKNKERLEELYRIPEKNRTDSINNEIEALQRENEELSRNITEWEKKLNTEKFNDLVANKHDLPSGISYSGKFDTDVEQYGGVAVNAEEALQQLVNIGAVAQDRVDYFLNEIGLSAEKTLYELGFAVKTFYEAVDSKTFYNETLKNYKKLGEAIKAGQITPENIKGYENAKKALEALAESASAVEYTALPEWTQELLYEFEKVPDVTSNIAEQYYNLVESLTDLNNGMIINDAQRELILKEYPEMADLIQKTADGWTASADALSDFYNKIGETSGELKGMEDIYQNLISGMGASEEEIGRLIQLYPQLSTMIKKNADRYYLEIQALIDSANAGDQWAINMINAQNDVTAATVTQIGQRIRALRAEIQAMQAGGFVAVDFGENPDILGEKQKQLADAEAALNNALAMLQYSQSGHSVGGIDTGGPSGGGGSSAKTDPIAEQNKLFKEQIEIMEHKLFLMEKEGATEEERIAQIKAIQAELQRQKQWYYDQGLDDNSKYIRDLEKQWWQYADQIKEIEQQQRQDHLDNLEKQKEDYEKAFAYLARKAQDEIDALEEERNKINQQYDDQIAALEKQNETLNAQIQLQEKLDALARARQQQVLVYKDGKFQYTNDIDAVSQAQKDVDAYNREQALQKEIEKLKEARDEQNRLIDEKIAYWEKLKTEWESIPNKWQEEQDKLLAEQVLGIELEGENWETRLNNLQDYVDKYNTILKEIETTKQEIEEAEQAPSAPEGMGGNSEATGQSQEQANRPSEMTPEDQARLDELGRQWNEATSQEERDRIHAEAEAIRAKYGYSGGVDGSEYIPINGGGYASGTTSAQGGISLVGENGPELRVLGKGDGILPANVTENLWAWGNMTPSALLQALSGGFNSLGQGVQIMIENFNPNLPNVSDGQGFADYMRNNFWRDTLQYVKV